MQIVHWKLNHKILIRWPQQMRRNVICYEWSGFEMHKKVCFFSTFQRFSLRINQNYVLINIQALLQSLYVSLGSATFGDVKDFIAQAKIKCPVNTTYSTNRTRPSVSSAKRTISSSLRETDIPVSDNSLSRQDGYAENVDELGSKHGQQEKEMKEGDSRTETFEKTEHDAKFIPISPSTAGDVTETSINASHSGSRPSSSQSVDDTESVVSSSVDRSCHEVGTCNLGRLKGIREFQRFLCDTPGEKIWNFGWILKEPSSWPARKN